MAVARKNLSILGFRSSHYVARSRQEILMSQIKEFVFDVNNFRHLENVHCCINKAKKRDREVGKSVMEVLSTVILVRV